MSLFHELKRRNVFRVGAAYAVSAWIILQLTDVVGDILDLPDWSGKLILVAVLAGFPLALIFAWAFELTPEGVKREKDVDRDQSITRSTGRTLDRAIIVLLVVALGYFIWESRFSGAPATAEAPASVSTASTTATPAAVDPSDRPAEDERTTTQGTVDPRSIAVLPFDNRSRLEDDAFFVEGIHDDLLTNLARIGELKVISRTSVLRYQDTTRPIPDIARELGVATVMEGAVQRSGNTVRVNVQLIDAATDEHLWAEIFDRELTADNLFAIQSEISQRIAEALKTTLSPEEQERISERPTDNLVAYSAYLRGRQLLNERNSDSVTRAFVELENAVAEDPEFALAWATLAEAHLELSRVGDFEGNPKDAFAEAEAAAERALGLDPNLGQAWTWRAVMLNLREQREAAEAAFRKSVELAPNNITVLRQWSDFLAWRKHRPSEALVPLDRAIELDPYSSVLRQSRGGLLEAARRYPQAAVAYEELIRMDPTFAPAHMSLANQYWRNLFRFGDALTHVRRAIELDPGNPIYLMNYHVLLRNLGATEQAGEVRRELQDRFPNHWTAPWIDLFTQIGEGQYDAGIETVRLVEPMFGVMPGMFGSMVALLHAAKGDDERAFAILVEREPRALQPESWDYWLPDNYGNTCDMGRILMRGGEPELGRQLAEQTLDYVLELQARGGDPHLRPLESCYLALGEIDLALVAIEQRFEHDHIDSWWSDANADWYPELRGNPRFAELIQSVEARVLQEHDRLVAEGLL